MNPFRKGAGHRAQYEDDRIVPVKDSAGKSAQLIKGAKEIYDPGAPHGPTAPHEDRSTPISSPTYGVEYAAPVNSARPLTKPRRCHRSAGACEWALVRLCSFTMCVRCGWVVTR